MFRNGTVATYSATAVPKLHRTNDVVSAIIDMRESLSPMRFRSLHPQYDKPTSEQYCAAMQAIMGLSKQPDGVDWQDLPDRDEIFVHHQLSESQQKALTDMVELFRDDKILVKEVETLGVLLALNASHFENEAVHF